MSESLGCITKNIEADKVDISLKKLKAEWLKKDSTSGRCAYAVLSSLNKLVLTALKNKKTCLSSAEDIYKLAGLCSNVESMWELDRSSCMQYIYHVMRYLLNQSHSLLATNLCEYFFQLKKKKTFKKWEDTEVLVLSNTVIYLVCYMNDISKDIGNVTYSPDMEILKTLFYTLKITELNDFTSTSYLFKVVFVLSRRAHNLLKHDDYIRFSMSVLNYFLGHLEKTPLAWNPVEENLICSMNLLSDIVFVFKNDDFSEANAKTLFDFMDCLQKLTLRVPHMFNGQKAIDYELLKITLQMCLYSNESSFSSYFEKVTKLFSTKTNSNCFPFIHGCFSTFRTKISSLLLKDDTKVKLLIPGLLKMYIGSKSKTVEESKVKKSELLHAFTNAMFFLEFAEVSSSTLSNLFKCIIMFFKEFESLIAGNKTSFDYGVNYCINVLQIYKESELHKETATLSKSLMKTILQLDPEFLSSESFELKLGRLLNFFIYSFGKMGLFTEAHIALIAFTSVHPRFSHVIFTYWAELKVNCQDNSLKDLTCYDIITSEKSIMEERWPPCKAESINVEKCLLEELKAYSKHRELQVGPVVAVYKVASKLVTNKPLLASIVTAAVDAISSDEYIPTLKNLHLSLQNLLNNNLKGEAQETNERKLCLHWLVIGDILYQLIRCDVAELRKKAEEEFSLMDLPLKEDIPVIEGEGTTVSITPAYACLKMAEQSQLFEKMTKVIYYWKKAGKIVTQEDNSFIHFRYMKGLAYICRLYSYKRKEREIWETVYQIAKKVSNHKYQILAVAELLVLKKNIDPNWVKGAEDLVTNEKIISKRSYIYSLFFVNLGKNLLINQKFDEAIQTVEKVNEYLLKRLFLVNAQHKLLMFYLNGYILDLSPELSLATLVKIFESILYLIKNSRWKTFCEKCILQWLLLEFSYIIGKTYYDLKLLRHARCYAKKQLVVAQRLALPVRVCEFLTVLSIADLQTGNRMDANGKLSGLDSILELDTVKVADVSDKTEVGFYFSQTSSEKDIGQPKFISHSMDCSCLMCDNVDFLLLTLEAYTLKGIFTSSAGAHSLAKHVFSLGVSLIEFADGKVEQCYSDLPNRYDEAKVRFYLNLTQAYENWGETEAALNFNNMILKSKETCSRILLEIRYHSAALDWLFYEKSPPIVYKPKLYKEANDSSLQNVKTPEHPKSLSILAVKGIKLFSSSKKFKVPVSPRASFVKKCVFEDSEDSSVEGGINVINKENCDVTPESKESKLKKDKNALAVPLPLSPLNSVKRNLYFGKLGNESTPKTSDWNLQTPQVTKTYNTRARKAKTEKKPIQKGRPAVDLFSTPFPTKTVPEIKVFCDEDDNANTVKTTKRRGRPAKATTTVKKTVKKEKQGAVELIGRRKLFEELSDTEEEVKHTRLGRRLFSESDEQEIEVKKKSSFPSSNDSTIIDASYIEKPHGNAVCLPLTPLSSGLEYSFKHLSISEKKDKSISLSTKNMKKMKTLQDTPQSSQAKLILRK